MDEILLLGVNHRFATVEVRERLAFSAEQAHKALIAIASNYPESELLILSTCNRSEIYFCSPDSCQVERNLRSFLSERSHLSPDTLDKLLYRYHGQDAVEHLLRVASGLHSLVLGENEILGQVKHAFEIAQEAGTVGAVLSAAYRYAIQTGKRVRTETHIAKAGRSVATVVVDLAQGIFGSLDHGTALIIGAGKISSLTARALVKAGLHCVFVANRTYEKAEKLAHNLGEHKSVAIHFSSLEDYLEKADIVICSTGAPHLVLHAEQVIRVMKKRAGRPLLVVDLAIPRDADPEIAAIPNVYLRDMDGLQNLVEKQHPFTTRLIKQAESIIQDELNAFESWLLAHRQAPLIRSLQAKANSIVQTELERTLRRLRDLSPEQQQAVEAMGRTIVKKLLHESLVCLRKPAENSDAVRTGEWVKRIFGLQNGEGIAEDSQIGVT